MGLRSLPLKKQSFYREYERTMARATRLDAHLDPLRRAGSAPTDASRADTDATAFDRRM